MSRQRSKVSRGNELRDWIAYSVFIRMLRTHALFSYDYCAKQAYMAADAMMKRRGSK